MPDDWEARARAFGDGLTVVRTDQCPYLDDGVANAIAVAGGLGIANRVVELTSAAEVRRRAPTPYGVFALVRDGALVSYHYQLRRPLARLLAATR